MRGSAGILLPAATTMHSFDWFPRPRAKDAEGGIASAAIKAAVGLGVGAIFFLRGHVTLAAIAGGLAVVFFAVSLAPKGRAALARAFAALGEWLGRAVGTALLSAIFLLVMTPVRALRRLAGADDLRLADHNERSYWLACDSEEHKRKYAGAMFATEARSSNGGRPWVAALVTAVVLLAGAEIALRVKGFGRPPLYLSDPATGYHLAAGQKTTWRGARFETNRVGMRAPERAPMKPKGALRVLTLSGDGGLHVQQDALFGRALERLLAEKADPAATVEVWNVDVAGWGPASMRGYVETFGTFEADVAVIALSPGALEQPRQSLLFTPFCPAGEPPRLALEEVLLDLLWQYRASRTPETPGYADTARELGVAEIAPLVRALRERKAEPVVVLATPTEGLSHGEETPYTHAIAAAVAAGAHTRGVPANFLATGIDPETGELTANGHAALAALLADDLLEHSERTRAWAGAKAR